MIGDGWINNEAENVVRMIICWLIDNECMTKWLIILKWVIQDVDQGYCPKKYIH